MLTTECFLCESKELNEVIDLGFHPLADTFLKPEQLNSPEIRYPLGVVACQSCGHLMNSYIVPAEARYQENDYSYDSSNSKVSIAHFDDFAQEVTETVGVTAQDLVIDIGSNVGTLLLKFKAHAGSRVFGIEPSPNIAEIAQKEGINTLNAFFNQATVNEAKKESLAKVITGTNVYNHIEDQVSFAKNIDELLAPDGSLVVEMPYAGTLVDETSFDTIYLEHVSYFLVKPLKEFWKKQGFKIHQLNLNDYMGGSMRVYLSRHLPESPKVQKLIDQEQENGYFDSKTYEQFMERTVQLKVDLMKELYDIKKSGGKIIAIGAATKGNTLLNYCGIDSSIVEYVTDASQLKIGKYTPGSHLLIRHDDEIDNTHITHGVILPWNIGEFLSKKLSPLGIEFIVPHLKD